MGTNKPDSYQFLQLRLLGISGENELHLIKEGLLKMEGVKGVEIDLLKRVLTIEYDTKLIVVEMLIEKIEDMGFGALTVPQKNEKKHGERENNICNNCVNTLFDSMKRLDSIVELKIDLETNKVFIKLRPNTKKKQGLKKNLLQNN